MGPITFEEYMRDVQSAHARDDIVLGPGADLQGTGDQDSHILHGVQTNMARLTETGRWVLYALLRTHKGEKSDLRWLSLGAGIGREIAEVHDAGVIVDIEGWTPIATHIKPEYSIDNRDYPRGRLGDMLAKQVVTLRYRDPVTDERKEVRKSLFERVDTPIVRKQYAGPFGTLKPADTYHVIYDRNGAFYYTSQQGREEYFLEHVLSRLKPTGVFVINESHLNQKHYDYLVSNGWRLLNGGYERACLMFRDGAKPWQNLYPDKRNAIESVEERDLQERLSRVLA